MNPGYCIRPADSYPEAHRFRRSHLTPKSAYGDRLLLATVMENLAALLAMTPDMSPSCQFDGETPDDDL